MMYHKRIVEKMNEFLDFKRIEELAAETGFIKRKRKIAGVDFLCALAFGNGHGDTRSLADIRRFMTSVADFDMTSSAFQGRFTAEAVDFLKGCYAEILSNYLQNSTAITYSTELKNFKDVKAIDSTVMILIDKLARIFRGYKNAGAKAALKFTGVMSLQSGVFEQSYVHSARNRKKEWPRLSRGEIANCLILFDLGLASWKWFRKIDKNGGNFITRVKSSGNPRIVAINAGARFKRGRENNSMLNDLEFCDDVYDVVIDGTKGARYRVVGTWNEDKNEWHEHVTNLPTEQFSPGKVAEAYSLRWQIEILFKELKGLFRIDHLTSGRREVVECQIWGSLIGMLVSRCMTALTEKYENVKATKLSLRKVSMILLNFRERLSRAFVKNIKIYLYSILIKITEAIARNGKLEKPTRKRYSLSQGMLHA